MVLFQHHHLQGIHTCYLSYSCALQHICPPLQSCVDQLAFSTHETQWSVLLHKRTQTDEMFSSIEYLCTVIVPSADVRNLMMPCVLCSFANAVWIVILISRCCGNTVSCLQVEEHAYVHASQCTDQCKHLSNMSHSLSHCIRRLTAHASRPGAERQLLLCKAENPSYCLVEHLNFKKATLIDCGMPSIYSILLCQINRFIKHSI